MDPEHVDIAPCGEIDRLGAHHDRADQIAIGALHAAHALGVSVPRQISIVGFDDIPLAQYTAPPLTTVSQPMGEMAELAVRLAVEARTHSGIDRVFPTTLSLRSTTGPVPS
ncbi:MAG TPA: substrate-binding domain-containing protein [Ilumatobacteraceae bacterium]|nr:substrate-binding domain-containing protein [Ilumatobacteraceae bacterium]